MECSCCDSVATHILVNSHQDIVDANEVFCPDHAFEEGRQKCPWCDGYEIEIDDNGNEIKLFLTYAPGELDEDRCCCEHP
jgi:hypothetical protein